MLCCTTVAVEHSPFIESWDSNITSFSLSVTETSMWPQWKLLSYYWPWLHRDAFILTSWLHFKLNLAAHKVLCSPIQTNLKRKLWINCHANDSSSELFSQSLIKTSLFARRGHRVVCWRPFTGIALLSFWNPRMFLWSPHGGPLRGLWVFPDADAQ